MAAIRRLWVVVLVQIRFFGDRRAVGRSIIVGIIIFSIVGGLGYVGGQNHVFGLMILVWPGLFLPHMQRKLVLILELK